jgi:tetratricopeptide (TPR) repeat protein
MTFLCEGHVIPELSPGASSTEVTPQGAPGKGLSWKAALITLVVIVIGVVIGVVLRPPPTELDIAINLIKTNRHAAAIPMLEDIARKQPDNEEVSAWLAQGYLRTDRIAEGRTALDTALRYNVPGSVLVPVVLSYAEYYENKDDFAEAERLFVTAQTAVPEKELQGGRASLYMRWAEHDTNAGDTEAALKHLQQAYQLMPETDPAKATVPHKISEYYRELAAVAETRKNDDKQAIQLLESSLKWADEPATRMALGSIYLRLNNSAKAIENYQRVSEEDENNLEARHRLIDLHMAQENYAAAQQALMELTEKERSVENFEMLANLSMKIDNYAAAVRALEDAIVLRPKDVTLLGKLHTTLADWAVSLSKQGKPEQSTSVKGHADRVAELIKELQKENEKPLPIADKGGTPALPPGAPPVSLVASRIWLAKGSYTPEGEIRFKNISGRQVTDLALNMVIYDNTTHKRTGSVTVNAASESHPLEPNAIQSVYFSSPTTVKTDHHLAVIIFWKGRLLKELPVVKER